LLIFNKKQGTREQESALVSFIAGRKDRCRAVTRPVEFFSGEKFRIELPETG
jgi:hypothetical protein